MASVSRTRFLLQERRLPDRKQPGKQGKITTIKLEYTRFSVLSKRETSWKNPEYSRKSQQSTQNIHPKSAQSMGDSHTNPRIFTENHHSQLGILTIFCILWPWHFTVYTLRCHNYSLNISLKSQKLREHIIQVNVDNNPTLHGEYSRETPFLSGRHLKDAMDYRLALLRRELIDIPEPQQPGPAATPAELADYTEP